jgi:hypothetical protein
MSRAVDRGPDPANPTKAKPAALDSAAYVLRQMRPDSPWLIVDRSGPSRIEQPRPNVDGRDPMEAMQESADRRQEFVEARRPDDHVLFLAVPREELGEYGIRR